MSTKLTFKILSREQQHSAYDWLNVDCGSARVGKVRGLIDNKRLTINSIYIFPEFEGNGYGEEVVKMFKSKFDTIVADRVRHTAIGFWERMGFKDSCDGNYVWNRRPRKRGQ